MTEEIGSMKCPIWLWFKKLVAIIVIEELYRIQYKENKKKNLLQNLHFTPVLSTNGYNPRKARNPWELSSMNTENHWANPVSTCTPILVTVTLHFAWAGPSAH